MTDATPRTRSLSRRSFLATAAGAVAWGLVRPATAARRIVVPRAEPSARTADACIFVVLRGGASQLETFDPRPDHPHGAGVRAIPTRVPGLRFAEFLPELAVRAQAFTTIRSLTGTEANHERALSILRTGHPMRVGQVIPGLGAALASAHVGDLPGHVVLGGGGQPAGPLGAACEPFRIHDPRPGVPGIVGPRAFAADRRERVETLRALFDEAFAARIGDPSLAARREVLERAHALLASPALDAFDLERESASIRERYGNDRFGQSCLLARRLVDAGVPYVEVELGSFDSHRNHLQRARDLGRNLDRGLSALLDDLAASGRLARTLVVVCGEFGRSPRMNVHAGRDHHPALFAGLVAGGGAPGGGVVGAGAADGMAVAERPVTVPDLLRTVGRALGLPDDFEIETSRGRPLVLLGDGRAIDEIVPPVAG